MPILMSSSPPLPPRHLTSITVATGQPALTGGPVIAMGIAGVGVACDSTLPGKLRQEIIINFMASAIHCWTDKQLFPCLGLLTIHFHGSRESTSLA